MRDEQVQRNKGTLPGWGLVLLVCAFAIPFVFSHVPPLIDLPGHLGRYRVQLDLGSSPNLHRWYDFHWRLVPNLGVDLLVQLLSPVLGLEPALKLVTAAIPPLTAAGFLWASEEVHEEIPPTAYFALPLAYSFAFQFGFLNFCLSMGMAFAAFALWLRLGKSRRTKLRMTLFVPLGALIWVAHLYGWAMLALLCFAAELFPDAAARKPWRAAIARAAMAVLPVMLPLLMTLVWRSEGGGATDHWFSQNIAAGWLAGVLRDRWFAWDILSAAILLGVVVAALARPRDFRFDPRLAIGAAGLWLACILLPHRIFGSGYAAARLVPYALAVTILAIRPTAACGARGLTVCAAIGFCLLRLGAGSLSYALYGREIDRDLEALNAIPEGSAVVAFAESGCDQWAKSRVAHLPSFATVRRDSFSNDQWQSAPGLLLSVTYTKAGDFKADPSGAVEDREDCAPRPPRLATKLPRVPWDAFDYLWLVDVPARFWPNHPTLKPVWRNHHSVLLRIQHGRVPVLAHALPRQ
jgi:hypothetical protein